MRVRVNRPAVAAAVVLATALVAVGLAQTAAGRSMLRDAGLIGDGDPYTELAFRAPTKLPKYLPTGTSDVRVRFSIHNVEGADRTYRWSILQDGDSKLATGVARVADGRSALVRPRVAIACEGRRTRIDVELDSGQSIGFWARCADGDASG